MVGVNGWTVGSPERFRTSPDEVLQKIADALTLFLDAGRLLDADILHRRVCLVRLVQSASTAGCAGLCWRHLLGQGFPRCSEADRRHVSQYYAPRGSP